MRSIQYVGEHPEFGIIGHILILVLFVSALLSTWSYWSSTRQQAVVPHSPWIRLGRISFITHGISLFVIMGMLFFMMGQKLYAYYYVHEHVNDALENRYIFSAFWEGQEGSFMLWMFWHVILGFILIWKSGKWEPYVMTIFAAVEAFLATMLLGLYFGEHRFGSNPFVLLRDIMDAPVFANANYVSLLKGKGLNALLQNYWMTIHPPTLFLGFASTLVPFAYAVAGLWKNDHRAFLDKVLPWSLFSAAILGTGILMGGAWAYEALSFGGYWAWDPVENTSLVPWLILVAGIHTNLVARATGHSYRSTYLFYILGFLLILYSTFLTRSGVLGDSSVHAFTEMGLEWQLIALILTFSGIGFYMYWKNRKNIPAHEKEEGIQTREFWMFTGSLVLLFSAILITFTTSIPVYNKLFDAIGWIFGTDLLNLHRSAPIDPVAHYNKYQLWIAVFIGFMSGFAQYLRYRENRLKDYQNRLILHIGMSLAFSIILTGILATWIDLPGWQFGVLLFALSYTICANGDYFIRVLKANPKQTASVLSHMGFGIMLVGSMVSGLNKRYISSNPFVMRDIFGSFDEERLNKNVYLLKGAPMFMNGHWVTYEKDTLVGLKRFYHIRFKKVDDSMNVVDEFLLQPNLLYEKDYSKVAAVNPDTRHYLSRDIFTHVPSIPPQDMELEMAQEAEDTLKYINYRAHLGDTIDLPEKRRAILTGINFKPKHPDYTPQTNDLAIGLSFDLLHDNSDSTFQANPMLALRDQLLYRYPVHVNPMHVKIQVNEETLDAFLPLDDSLNYEQIQLRDGEWINWGTARIGLEGFIRNPDHPQYQAQEGDVAIAAAINILSSENRDTVKLKPVYIIRENRQFNIKDFDPASGWHVRFDQIDPASGTMTFSLARSASDAEIAVSFDIAGNAARRDYIVLEAIEFPGINLFWLGSIMMMAGLFTGMSLRLNRKPAS